MEVNCVVLHKQGFFHFHVSAREGNGRTLIAGFGDLDEHLALAHPLDLCPFDPIGRAK